VPAPLQPVVRSRSGWHDEIQSIDLAHDSVTGVTGHTRDMSRQQCCGMLNMRKLWMVMLAALQPFNISQKGLHEEIQDIN